MMHLHLMKGETFAFPNSIFQPTKSALHPSKTLTMQGKFKYEDYQECFLVSLCIGNTDLGLGQFQE